MAVSGDSVEREGQLGTKGGGKSDLQLLKVANPARTNRMAGRLPGGTQATWGTMQQGGCTARYSPRPRPLASTRGSCLNAL